MPHKIEAKVAMLREGIVPIAERSILPGVLKMGVRKFLVGALALVLLVWGPIEHSRPYGPWIRVLYLVAIPAAAWFALAWIWRAWQPDAKAEERLVRTLAGLAAGVLFVGAVIAAQGDHHRVCAEGEGTWDEGDCFRYELAPGPDLAHVVLLAGGGVLAAWFGIKK